MAIDVRTVQCPKCDNNLELQTDGSTLALDISHNRESVYEALKKMEEAIDLAKKSSTQFLKLIVGGGLIREEVSLALIAVERRLEIKSFQRDNRNAGVIIVQLK